MKDVKSESASWDEMPESFQKDVIENDPKLAEDLQKQQKKSRCCKRKTIQRIGF